MFSVRSLHTVKIPKTTCVTFVCIHEPTAYVANKANSHLSSQICPLVKKCYNMPT